MAVVAAVVCFAASEVVIVDAIVCFAVVTCGVDVVKVSGVDGGGAAVEMVMVVVVVVVVGLEVGVVLIVDV